LLVKKLKIETKLKYRNQTAHAVTKLKYRNQTADALIHGHGEGKNWKLAYHLLIEMLGLGLLPNIDTSNLVESLLKEHGRLGLCVKLDTKLENQKLQKLCRGGELNAAYKKVILNCAKCSYGDTKLYCRLMLSVVDSCIHKL